MNGFVKIWTVFLAIFVILVWVFVGWPRIWPLGDLGVNTIRIPPEIREVWAANYLSNPSFTGGTTDWTPSVTTYNSTYYQDTAGSIETTAGTGRNNEVTGTVTQTIGTSINSTDTVLLSLYWSKQSVAINCAKNDIRVEIEKPSAPGVWVSIWSDTTVPTFNGATAWAGVNSLDVSSDFTDTGTYNFRFYANVRNGNNGSAACFAWFDNATLDVSGAANSAPTVSSVNISPSPITLTENGTTTVTVTATITDDNGCDEVLPNGTITATLYRSSLGASCSQNWNNCYINIPLTEVDDTCTGGADTEGDASGTVEVWYIAEATDASSSYSGDTWQATVKAIDSSDASSTNTDGSPPELSTLLAIDVTANINYGSVNPNATSSTQTVTITNTGNYNSTDANFSGVNLESGGNSITVGSQKYSTTTNEFWDYLDFTLDGNATRRELNIVKGTATGTPSTQNNYWAIQVPNGTPAGTYNGTTTIEAQ